MLVSHARRFVWGRQINRLVTVAHTFCELTGMQLDYITVLLCAKDDVIIVPITSVRRLGR